MRHLLFIAALIGVSLSLVAGGFQLYSESATDVLAVGGAGVARGGEASAAWYNPATTIDIDRPTITGGGSLLRLAIEYKTSKRTDEMNDEPRMTGFIYGVMPLNEDFRLNLAVNVPNGMITQWESDSQLKTLATFTSLRVCHITPSLTWKATDKLSLAAGPTFTIGVARLANYIDLTAYGQGMNKNYMSAYDFGLGGFVAAYYKLNDEWAFGAKYQSRIRMTFKGDNSYRYKSYLNGAIKFVGDDLQGRIDMPAYLSLGVRNNSFEKWTFLFDAVWTEWSSYKALNIEFDTYPGKDTPGTAANKRKWHDVWSYHFGAEYELTDRWTLRAGYCFDVSPSNSRYQSPEMPDSNKHLFTVGFKYETDNWGFDFGYGYTYFYKSHLGKSVAKSHGIAERGRFSTDCHILSASLTLKF